MPVADSFQGQYVPSFGGGTGNNNNNNNGGSSGWNTGFGSSNGGSNGFYPGSNYNQPRFNEPYNPRSTFRSGRKKRQSGGGGEYLPPLLNYHAATVAGMIH